ncbi:bifunctional DNA primase/polymerase, partial [Mesorhizobium sp. M7A.T.Ca.TU.009.02.1.1]|uniref:bifunctional DNA primase/polymerase n=2 Tax=unclassified Mesorhizobium TaxID=325217 RepID=UPI000FD3D2C3
MTAAKQNRRPGDTGPAAGDQDITQGRQGIYSDEAAHASLPALLTAELGRLFQAGFSLLPLGGDDGKKPIVAFKDRSRLPLGLVVNRMAGAGSNTFGIRLEGLLVVDVDTDTPKARAYVEMRFGTSPVSTKTSRGFHLYFRHNGSKPPSVDRPDIKIDFKAGGNEFVVGAHSERPDGSIYWPIGKLVSFSGLPELFDREVPGIELAKTNGRFPIGCRREMLKRRARQLALRADTFDDLVQNLVGFREWEIERPEDFSDGEISEMAAWFWKKRDSGKLWSGSNSVVMIERTVIDKLVADGEFTAYGLYSHLKAIHPAEGAKFAIVPDGL